MCFLLLVLLLHQKSMEEHPLYFSDRVFAEGKTNSALCSATGLQELAVKFAVLTALENRRCCGILVF